MYKKLIIILCLLITILGFSLGSVSAKTSEEGMNVDIPERNGVYDVPGRPDLKVRVFVHNPRPAPTSSPVLSCTDLDSNAVVSVTGWKLPGTWNYNLNVSSVPTSVGPSNLPTIASDAFGNWSNAIANKVTFARSANTSATRAKLDGQNIIAWGRTQGTALAVTYTWYYTSNNQVAEVDTIMNNKFQWSWTSPSIINNVIQNCSLYSNTYDAQDILTHELGHWMGLDDEYTQDFVNNTMYGYGAKGEIKKDTLTTGDILGVSSIYP